MRSRPPVPFIVCHDSSLCSFEANIKQHDCIFVKIFHSAAFASSFVWFSCELTVAWWNYGDCLTSNQCSRCTRTDWRKSGRLPLSRWLVEAKVAHAKAIWNFQLEVSDGLLAVCNVKCFVLGFWFDVLSVLQLDQAFASPENKCEFTLRLDLVVCEWLGRYMKTFVLTGKYRCILKLLSAKSLLFFATEIIAFFNNS